MGRELITYISTFDRKCIRKGKGVPVEAGSADRSDFLYAIHDDTGDNISGFNEYYGDLTVLYWIWKNGITAVNKYVSFRHYNKYLMINEKKATGFLRSEKQGWIVAKKMDNPPHNFTNEWEAFRDLIKNKYSFYYQELLNTYDEEDGSGHKCNATNMFITSVEQLEKYCNIVFRICKDLRDEIGDTDHSKSDQRYCAFMAERFLTVYINAHGFPKMEVDVCRDKWHVRIMSKAVKAVGVNNNRIVKNAASVLRKSRNKSSYSE